MLNIGRVGPGGHRYYLKQVVAGAEDYYVERGEEPGVWIGDGARTLSLEGRVEADDLKAVLTGWLRPADGGEADGPSGTEGGRIRPVVPGATAATTSMPGSPS